MEYTRAIRHIFSAIAAGCLVLGLTACGGGLTADDAATFVLGDLDAAYKGEIRQEYLDLLTDTTEEDARQTYQDNIAIEAEYLLGYLETAYSSGGYYDDGLQASMDQIYADVVEKAQDLTAQIYSRAQYSVGQADKLDSGDFAVEVTVSPIEVVSLIPAEVYAEKWSSVQTARGITSDEQVEAMSDEDYMAMDAEYGMAMLDYLEELLPQLSYGEEQSIMVQLKQEEDGNYSPVSTGWQKIDEVMIDYAGAYLK